MRTPSRSAVLAATVLLLGASAVTSAAVASADPLPPPATHDDFNADGYPDLVVSAPSATVKGRKGAGYIAVLYGSAKGYSKKNRTVISQNTPHVPGGSETGDAFGKATASGDMDADGYPDLLVGSPGEDVGTVKNAGAVTVLWGGPRGVTGAGLWTQAKVPAAGDAYGTGIAAGDFNGTGGGQHAVLADEAIWLYTWTADAGARGTAADAARRPVTAVRTPVGGDSARAAVEVVTYTGLTTGDYNGDHRADLMVLGKSAQSGRSRAWGWYMPGTAEGPGRAQLLAAGTVGATGDIDRDGYDDLVSSYPDQVNAAGKDTTGGTVRVFYGGAAGLPGSGRQALFTQDSPDVWGTSEPFDRFGSDLSVGDVNGDGYGDVAVGGRGEDLGAAEDAGAVWVLNGSAEGLTGIGSALFYQETPEVPGVAETGDAWGSQIRLADSDRDGNAELMAAAPGENGGNGYVWVLPGEREVGSVSPGSWTFSGASLGAPSAGARFGAVLAE